jgi:hypothetical protein
MHIEGVFASTGGTPTNGSGCLQIGPRVHNIIRLFCTTIMDQNITKRSLNGIGSILCSLGRMIVHFGGPCSTVNNADKLVISSRQQQIYML